MCMYMYMCMGMYMYFFKEKTREHVSVHWQQYEYQLWTDGGPLSELMVYDTDAYILEFNW